MLKIPNDIDFRSEYIDRIIPYIGKKIIKVLIGQRRVGKSYLLFQLIAYLREKDKDASIIYINKEDLAFSFIKTAQDLYEYINTRKKISVKNYVFIDEIQEITDFAQALRSLLLDDDFDIYCTGSNANLLSSDIAGFLSGRYIEVTVYSLSYPEFIQFHKLKEDNKALEMYLKYGGLPYLKHLDLKDAIVFDYLKNIYTTILYKDVVNRYSIRNTLFFEQLVQFLASNTGSLFSAKKISDFLKSQKVNMAPNQVQTYTQYLANAFLVHKVMRYDIVGKRLFEIGEKIYFENLGIRNGIWGYRLEDRGKIVENVVLNHLLFKRYKVHVGTLGNEEIDFVCEKDNERLYIQVALTLNSEKTIEREFGNLMKIKDNYPKIVITMDTFEGNSFEGIKHVNLRDFLLS